MQSQPRKLRRTANACVSCRQSKIKCSGEEPCVSCQRRYVKCRFEEGTNKVAVSERYLQELQKQARDQQCTHSANGIKRSIEAVFGSGDDGYGDSSLQPEELPPLRAIDDARSVWTSPFSKPSTTIKSSYKDKRNWIWLAPSSTWSFTVRLTLLLSEKLNLEYSAPNFFGADIYPLKWSPPVPECTPDIGGLPSIDHALYLLDTVKFHLGQNYISFDEAAFIRQVREFYSDSPVKKASESPLWFVRFLLVLAFGNAFLSRSRNTSGPPGVKFFIRAMSLMPDITSLWKNPLSAIEVLALAGLYSYSIDHRESAHLYVGQAIRIAQLEGLHTQLPEDELGADVVMRCRHTWWTLYIMDRHFSLSLGLPTSTQDIDITTLNTASSTSSERDSLLSLQVRLSRSLSLIIKTIYKTEQTQLGNFLEIIRSILQSMARHAQEIERIIHAQFENSVDAMSKETRHVTLLYHQCVILATRPLLLSLLKERLEKLDRGEEDWRSFLVLTKPLISTGIKSAGKTLQILSDEDGLLEHFLPFDLEFTYGAAMHLAMANALFPHLEDDQTRGEEAHAIFDEMIFKGNKVAESRKSELTHLEKLFDELARRAERRGLDTLTLSTSPDTVVDSRNVSITNRPVADYESGALPIIAHAQSSSCLPLVTTNHEFLGNIGISSYEFLSIVDQMGDPDTYYSMLDLEQQEGSEIGLGEAR